MQDGTQAEDVTDKQIEGTPYITTPVVPHKKYELVEMPENYTGTYEKPETVVVYYYKGVPSPGVIVHHINTETKEKIAEDDIVPVNKQGKYGDVYTTVVKEELLENYEFVTKTDNWQGIMTDELIEVTYEYRLKYNMQITKYKSGTEEKIQGVKFNLKGEGITKEGKDYITNSEGVIQINGLLSEKQYTLQEISTNNNYVLNDEIIVIQTHRENGILTAEVTSGTTKQVRVLEPVQDSILPIVQLEIENEPKYELNIIKYKKGTLEKISGVTFNIKGEGLPETGSNYTTDTEGNIKVQGLIPEKEYTIQETKTNSDYMLDDQIITIKTHKENGELTTESINGTIKTIEVEQAEEGKNPQVNISIENEPKYNIQITKYETGTNKTIPKVRFNVKENDNMSEGKIYTTDDNGIITINRLELGKTYTIKEKYAKGYYVDEREFTVKIERIGEKLQLQCNGRDFRGTPTIKIEENKIPMVQIDLENVNIPKYTLELTKVAEKTGKLLEGAVFEVTGAGRDEPQEKRYTTDKNGKLTIENLYENEEYTLKEIKEPKGYVLSETQVVFKATRNAGTWSFEVISGEFLENPIIENSEVKVKFENESLFKLQKLDKKTNEPLEGAKFTIKDINGNNAKDLLGNEVGTIEIINGIEMRVLTTDKDGIITTDLQSDLYQVIEVQAPEGYNLPENSVQYFGIGEGQRGQKEISIEWATSVGGVTHDYIYSVAQTSDGGYIAGGSFNSTSIQVGNYTLTNADQTTTGYRTNCIDGMLIKYSSSGEVEWQHQ